MAAMLLMFPSWLVVAVLVVIGLAIGIPLLSWLAGVTYIPHGQIGVIERLWSPRGSLTKGAIIALQNEAGYQADILRGGLHMGYYPFAYRVHRQPLVMIAESKIGYVYARDGEPLPPAQTLGRSVVCKDFQDAREFLQGGGQRGRQRAILREGVYAINTALFVIVTEDRVYSGPLRDREAGRYLEWREELSQCGGFSPVIVGHGTSNGDGKETDRIGIVTVTDGSPIPSGEIIAPEVKPAPGKQDHDYFQNPDVFLALGGRRGKQLQVLTDGTFYINRWFATVEMRNKTLIPIGYVGVVVSFYGVVGQDLTGESFRYGEQVEPGHKGVWKHALPPGKYALNPYAITVEYVPTINFVLRWITGTVETHQYDKDLTSIELITADGYEPLLPLSLVLHIDYQKAPRVVQRFGDVKRLISQTLDPILSAYFRDVAQGINMLDLLTHREEIQKAATQELGRRFQEYDINCIAVMIGRPESSRKDARGEDPIEKLFDQLRIRRLAEEQVATFAKQQEAASHLKALNEAQAVAEKQTELTQTRVNIEISGNKGEAALAEARRLADRDVVRAQAESTVKETVARGEGQAKELLGRGEASRIAQVGLAEASVFLKKIQAYGDPKLFALADLSEKLAGSSQPLVPEKVFLMGGGSGDGQGSVPATQGLYGPLLALLLAEKSGMAPADPKAIEELSAHAAAVAAPSATKT